MSRFDIFFARNEDLAYRINNIAMIHDMLVGFQLKEKLRLD